MDNKAFDGTPFYNGNWISWLDYCCITIVRAARVSMVLSYLLFYWRCFSQCATLPWIPPVFHILDLCCDDAINGHIEKGDRRVGGMWDAIVAFTVGQLGPALMAEKKY